MKFLAILFTAVIAMQWGTDFETAKKTARQEHKLILLNFSGSDWCAPCILTRKEYFENDAFIKMADKNLVLVNADFPRRKKNQPAPEQVKKNEALAEKYNKEGNFPYTLLLDAEGNVLKSWVGKPEEPVEKWIAGVEAVCKVHK
ncbi:thioredoxin family protein [Flavobacterium rhizosphaerae]|uniref:Thioredoxin family protein n=1 Tax=Flavobacterium rhizosphaerae TaxID=3163298 RepID=A0ABW8YRH9_9FLAO